MKREDKHTESLAGRSILNVEMPAKFHDIRLIVPYTPTPAFSSICNENSTVKRFSVSSLGLSLLLLLFSIAIALLSFMFYHILFDIFAGFINIAF